MSLNFLFRSPHERGQLGRSPPEGMDRVPVRVWVGGLCQGRSYRRHDGRGSKGTSILKNKHRARQRWLSRYKVVDPGSTSAHCRTRISCDGQKSSFGGPDRDNHSSWSDCGPDRANHSSWSDCDVRSPKCVNTSPDLGRGRCDVGSMKHTCERDEYRSLDGGRIGGVIVEELAYNAKLGRRDGQGRRWNMIRICTESLDYVLDW